MKNMKRRINNRLIALIVAITTLTTMGVMPVKAAQTTGLTQKVAQSPNTQSTYMRNADELMDAMTIGWNLGNSLDSYYNKDATGIDAHVGYETKWGNPKVTKELIAYVKSLGFNSIRIPVTWTYNSGRDENGHLVVGKKWLARVKEVVDYAYDLDMYIVLDSHHDMTLFKIGLSDADFEQVNCDMKDLWTQVAAEFTDYDDHLMFESFNEIYSNSDKKWNDVRRVDENAMKQYNTLVQTFSDAIKSTGGNNATRTLVLGCPLDSTNQNSVKQIMTPLGADGNRFIYDAHAYSGLVDQAYEEVLNTFREFTDRTGARVIFGECGSKSTYSPAVYREQNATNMISRAYAAGIRCFIWDNGALDSNGSVKDYGLVNRKDFSKTNTKMVEAYMKGLTIPNGYKTTNYVEYTGADTWAYTQLNSSTGEHKTPNGWDYYTTNNHSKGEIIPAGSKYIELKLTCRNDAWESAIFTYVFYDENYNYISGKQPKSATALSEIPDGAKYVEVCLYDAYYRLKKDLFYKYINDGDLKLCISFLEAEPTYILDYDDYESEGVIPVGYMGWRYSAGRAYWYEDSIKQGTYKDPKGVLGDGTVRGREIYDPDSDGWYWLDSCYEGAKAVNKEVWIPYIYQQEASWDAATIATESKASGDMASQVVTAINEKLGKWVRYDANGKMVKGWYTVEGTDARIYPAQAGNTYYYDPKTGLMAKGYTTIDGVPYHFDEKTGVLQK